MELNFCSLKNKLNLLFSVGIAGICLSNVFSLQQVNLALQDKTLSKEDYLKDEKLKEVNLNILKEMPSLGFKNFIADMGYLGFLQYFGDTDAREATGYKLSPDYFEILVKNDPRFVRPYFLMSPATSIFAGYPEKSVSLTEEGLSKIKPDSHPQAYYLWLYKATDEVLFLRDIEAAKNSYEMAAQWAENSNSDLAKQSAINIRQTARFFADDPDSTIAQIGAWTMVLSSTSDEKTQQKAIQKIEELGGQIVITSDGNLSVKVPG